MGCNFVYFVIFYVSFGRLKEEHPDEDASVKHGQSSRRAYFRELKKVGGWEGGYIRTKDVC